MGWQEILLIAVVVLLMVKPHDMPALMKEIGQFFGKLKNVWREFQDDIDRTERNLKIKSLEGLNDIDSGMKDDLIDSIDQKHKHESKK